MLETFKDSKKIKCIVYNSSSVYGKVKRTLFKDAASADFNYAATKICMSISNVYLDLYKLKVLVLDFLQYMALVGQIWLTINFVIKLKNETIKVFMGKHKRSFTYR